MYTCFRAKPVPMSHIMGDLPSSRVGPTTIFSAVGTDFAGPSFKGRSYQKQKSSKGIHMHFHLPIEQGSLPRISL